MTTPPLDLGTILPRIAPCEHIAGSERFMRKALEIQGNHVTPRGQSLVDVTLDLEDGARVGEEATLRKLIIEILHSSQNRLRQAGVRIHSSDSEHHAADLAEVLKGAGSVVAYITVPKVSSAVEVAAIAAATHPVPLHILIETPGALREVEKIAAIPQVITLDFGLMDFISHLGGGISAACMRSPGQFDHKLISRAKESISMAALSAGKVPSHNVTVDVRNREQAYADARQARAQYGFLRMWSVHPTQIEPIIRGILPDECEVLEAKEIIDRAKAAQWGPIEVNGRLHDRASYRYYWQLLERSAL